MEFPSDGRIRLLSVCAGAGIGTAVFEDTNYFSSLMEIELEEDSAEVLQTNFPNSFIFNEDLRDCGSVVKSSVAFVSLPCNEFSTLGHGQEGTFDNLVLAASEILKASDPSMILFENVPQFYESKSYWLLKSLLKNDYPFWKEKTIESWSFGSIALRNRTYAVCFQN